MIHCVVVEDVEMSAAEICTVEVECTEVCLQGQCKCFEKTSLPRG